MFQGRKITGQREKASKVNQLFHKLKLLCKAV